MRVSRSFFLSLALITALAVLPAALLGHAALRKSLITDLRHELETLARLLAAQIGLPYPDGCAPPPLQDQVDAAARTSGTRFTVVGPEGRVLADSEEDPARLNRHDSPVRPEIAQALAGGGPGYDVRLSETFRLRAMYVAVTLEGTGGGTVPAGETWVVRASLPLQSLESRLAGWRRGLVAGVAGAAVLTLVLAWGMSVRLARPLEQMAAGADRFARGNLAHRLPEEGPREARAVAQALNRMAGELDARLDTILRQRNELEAVLTGMEEGVLALDADGCVTAANQAALELLGVEPGERVAGKPIATVCRQAALLDFLDLAREAGEATRAVPADPSPPPLPEAEITLRVDHGDGHGGDQRRVHVRVAPPPRGAPAGRRHIVVLRDLTQMRRLEAIRGEFVQNVSHEMRTPITAIQGWLDLLVAGAGDPEERRQYAATALRNTRRLSRILDDLLLLAGLGGGERLSTLERQPLAPALEEAVAQASATAKARNVRVETACPPDLEAPVNAPLLELAVANLVDNAAKYGQEGGTVRVAAARAGGAWIEITVADTGPGIPAEHLDRLFERFYRVDPVRSRETGGTGLGLAIARHIALAHGGNTRVQSQPGRGSVFTLALPATLAAATPADLSGPPGAGDDPSSPEKRPTAPFTFNIV